MRKKAALGCALIHNPSMLFLDEPLEGVDPVSADVIRQLLTRFVASGSTVPPSVGPSVRPSAPPPPEPPPEVETSAASYQDVGDGDIEGEEQPLELTRSPLPPPAEARPAVATADEEVFLSGGFEVVDEVSEPPTAAGTHGQIARLLADAAALRESGDAVKAIEVCTSRSRSRRGRSKRT